jgi:tRNA(Ile)-lysidine synthetase-like protein
MNNSNISFRDDQDYYCILNTLPNNFVDTPISLYQMKNIRNYWRENKNEWFTRKIIEHWEMEPIGYNSSIEQIFSYILQYDQLNRHPNSLSVFLSREIFNERNYIKYRFATSMALKCIHHSDFHSLQPHEKVFTLLTLRHNDNLSMKYLALNKIKEYIKQEKTKTGLIPDIYMRFIHATIMDIQNYKCKKSMFTNYGLNNNTKMHSPEVINMNEQTYNRFIDILDKKAYMKTIQEDTTVKNITTQSNKPMSETYFNNLIKHVKQKVIELLHKHKSKQETIPNIIISISGGVDSMLISYVLKFIQYDLIHKDKLYDSIPYTLSCVHISYGNRIESSKECQFVEWWCNHIIETPLYIRNIDEIQRERCSKMRTLYEDVTRRIRFSMYEYVCKQNSCISRDSFVVLGHNKDDCEENIFSNLSKNIHFDNLYGMTEYTIESNIQLWRPFLTISKTDIYNVAREKNIPYLFDSTPPWSQRGKMRNTLIPQIETFNPQIIPGLHEYIQHTNFLQKQWDNMFHTWIHNVHVERSCYYYINNNFNSCSKRETDFFYNNYKNNTFWVKFWFSLDIPNRPSNKSILNLIQYIDRYIKYLSDISNTSGKKIEDTYNKKCRLNKYYTFYVHNKKFVLERTQ